MATTTKTLTPTNQTITLPDMTERPNASVLVDGIGKDADAINALSEQIASLISINSATLNSQLNLHGYVKIAKIKNIVLLLFNFMTESALVNSTVATVPSAYRPSAKRTTNYNDDGTNRTLEINTDGTIVTTKAANSMMNCVIPYEI